MGFGIQVKAPDELYGKVAHIVMHKIKSANNGRKRRETLERLKGSDCMTHAPHCDWM